MKRGAVCIALLIAAIGCQKSTPPAPQDPEAFLKWSMDRYAEVPNFQAGAEVITVKNKQKLNSQVRTLRFEPPNKFRVKSECSDGVTTIAVSDGTRESDYDNHKPQNSANVGSPATLSGAETLDMTDPSLCGSVVYPFFGGSANFSKLVVGPVKQVGTATSPSGEKLRVILFNTPGVAGNVRALISEKTGFVQVFAFDIAKGKLAGDSFTEEFQDIRVGQNLSRGSFDPNIPGPAALAQLAIKPNEGETPIPIGTPAPDFFVKTLDGKSVTLASLKGHPVLIDFWATWCVPCREALPETSKITIEGEKKGLRVLAVSDEDVPKIQSFVKSQTYPLTAYRDENDQAQKAFQVVGLPSEIFLDAKGNIAAYLVGYHPSSDVLESLKKAGCALPE